MIKLNQLTTAEAMSHPDVAATVNALGKMCDELRTQNQALREALKDAAVSLQTISLLAGKQDCGMDSMSDVRGYARSRSIVAFTAAITQAEGGV